VVLTQYRSRARRTLDDRGSQFAKSKRHGLGTIHRSKDPASFIVLFGNSAALAGLVIAGIGIWAAMRC
jgi:hypothetical protein